MDNLKAKLTWAKEWAQAFIATKTGKVIAALLVVAALVGYAHHRGVVSTLDRLSMQEPASCPVADPIQTPAPAEDLAEKLSASEQEKARLQKKVSDYEKQLAKHRGKGGSFVLSPADARGLSNIK